MIKIKGADDLIDQLKENANLDDVKNTIKVNTVNLTNEMIRAASFTKGYQTGTTKRSIAMELRNDGFSGVTGPKTVYAPYLIYGTRHMNAQDFFRPAYFKYEQLFISDMKRLMK